VTRKSECAEGIPIFDGVALCVRNLLAENAVARKIRQGHVGGSKGGVGVSEDHYRLFITILLL
jgi:hypothetical protein